MATQGQSTGDSGSIAGGSTLPSTSSPTLLVSSTPIGSSGGVVGGGGGEFRLAQGQNQTQMLQQKANNFEPLDKSSSNTLKRNPKMELSKTDLLKLLGYLEGELQARDVVIATLKSEKMKHLLNSRYRIGTNDPHAALARDVAIVGGVIRNDNNQIERDIPDFTTIILKQKVSQVRMRKVLEEAEIRHRAVIKELEEEKRKHEHDTAQGDDITYGLEKERTRLKKELELERQEKKRLEMELKKESLALEMEKSRQKQIVLLLLAERKKIIMKYIEERKRSEDLAQILSEEKVRIDSMAEGLEEESKKSLQMEAELEKQLAQFDMERQQYRQALTKEEKKSKELEGELERMKGELESWKSGAIRGGVRAPLGATPPPPPAKPANLTAMPTLRPAGVATQALKGTPVLGTGTPMVSSKVVQPTATVSSVPVSGPTTGIARSVTPRQAMRGVTYGSAVAPASVTPSPSPLVTGPITNDSTAAITTQGSIVPGSVVPGNICTSIAGPQNIGDTNTSGPEPQTTEKRIITNDGKVQVAQPPPVSATTPVTSTQASVKQTFHVQPVASGGQAAVAAAVAGKKALVPRGIPPPVPPNKPIVPPKKEAAAYMRRSDPNQPLQDTLKLNKQGTCQNQGIIQAGQVQSSSPIPPHQQIPDETKPR